VAQFAGRAQDAGAVGPQALRRADQAELHRVPVQPRQQLAGIQPAGLQATGAVGLHVVGKGRHEEQRHMAEEVVKDIGLDHVVELFGLADPVGHREAALGQQREEGLFRDQARHGHDLPAGGAHQPLADGVKARDLLGRPQVRPRP
jgi:hypothetical protein